MDFRYVYVFAFKFNLRLIAFKKTVGKYSEFFPFFFVIAKCIFKIFCPQDLLGSVYVKFYVNIPSRIVLYWRYKIRRNLDRAVR